MVKTQKTKMIAIIALVVAICGMTLGFAAFSNTLTISSSATVTPNDSDFNVKAYGVIAFSGMNDLNNFSQYVSDVRAKAFVVDDGSASVMPTGMDAIIDNNGKAITISNLSASFTGVSQRIAYIFIIENKGLYKAYLDFSKFNFDDDGIFMGNVNSCGGKDGASSTLIEGACDSIYTEWQFSDSNYTTIEYDGMYEIAPNDFIILIGSIIYDKNGVLTDEPITINFDNIEIEFSSYSGENN